MAGRTNKKVLGMEHPETAIGASYGKLGTKLHYPLDLSHIKSRQDFDPIIKKPSISIFGINNSMAKAASTVKAKMLVVLQPILYLKTTLSDSENQSPGFLCGLL